MTLRLCIICKVNKTHRLTDIGKEMVPVCTQCFLDKRHEPLRAEAAKKSGEGEGVGGYLCPKCNVKHKAGSKIHKRHQKLLK